MGRDFANVVNVISCLDEPLQHTLNISLIFPSDPKQCTGQLCSAVPSNMRQMQYLDQLSLGSHCKCSFCLAETADAQQVPRLYFLRSSFIASDCAWYSAFKSLSEITHRACFYLIDQFCTTSLSSQAICESSQCVFSQFIHIYDV